MYLSPRTILDVLCKLQNQVYKNSYKDWDVFDGLNS